MKFLHCADLHLGCVGGQERMRAFERMLDFCKKEGVSVLLIAGDLFEAVRADERTRRRVFDLLAGNPSLCTMIAAGNHDRAARRPRFARRQERLPRRDEAEHRADGPQISGVGAHP